MTAATMPRKIRLNCSESALWQPYATRSARELGTNRNLFLFSRNQTVACINFVWAEISSTR
jgi:hypothetical protein